MTNTNTNAFIRRAHRWVSAFFLLTVVANLVALALDQRAVWIGLVALAPLVVLMVSGLYLLVQPHRPARRTPPSLKESAR